MNDTFFKVGFLITFVPGFISARYFHSLVIGLAIGFLIGLIGYFISVIYTFKKIRFQTI